MLPYFFLKIAFQGYEIENITARLQVDQQIEITVAPLRAMEIRPEDS